MSNSTQERRPTPDEMPGQKLDYPASQADMALKPDSDLSNYSPANKLQGKVAFITGGDSGIGRAVAIAYALEKADVAIFYDQNDEDAQTTREEVEKRGQKCLVIKGDVRDYETCQKAIDQIIETFGKLDILVNNAAYQMVQKQPEDLSIEQFRRTLETNVFGYFYMVKAALPHLKPGNTIINTGSIVGRIGKGMLIDYAASKGAVHAMTKSLAENLAEREIRVNSVVPGPVWTPNIPATMPKEKVANYDTDGAMKRAAQPEELAPAYVFMASQDSSFVTGALLEVTGGQWSNS